MSFTIALILSFLGLTICTVVSSAKHRNSVAWAAAGFFFPLIAIIAVLVVGSAAPAPGSQPS